MKYLPYVILYFVIFTLTAALGFAYGSYYDHKLGVWEARPCPYVDQRFC